MRNSSKLLVVVGLSAGMLAASAPAQAATLAPFATYSMTGTKTTIDWTKSGATSGSIFSTLGGGSSPGSPTVTFNFLDTTNYLSGLSAKLTLTGSEVGMPASGAVVQDGIGGSFNFLYTGPTQTFMGKTYTSGVTNLLSGVYTLGEISGTGTSGSFHDSSTTGTVTFTSDIITNLPVAVVSDFSFGLVSIGPPLGYTAGQSLNSFQAASTGIYSAGFDLGRKVPEPATWAMMITGLGMLGLAARRRRSLTTAAI